MPCGSFSDVSSVEGSSCGAVIEGSSGVWVAGSSDDWVVQQSSDGWVVGDSAVLQARGLRKKEASAWEIIDVESFTSSTHLHER